MVGKWWGQTPPLSRNPSLPICPMGMMVGVWGTSLAQCQYMAGTEKPWDCGGRHPGAPGHSLRSNPGTSQLASGTEIVSRVPLARRIQTPPHLNLTKNSHLLISLVTRAELPEAQEHKMTRKRTQ